MTKNIQVAIDGPSASGKSTVAKIIAKKLSYIYVDTGAMYRATALLALKLHLKMSDHRAICKALHHTHIIFKPAKNGQQVFIHYKIPLQSDLDNVTKSIRTPKVTKYASIVSTIPQVRKILTIRQRDLANNKNVIMDGRDIGTTVLPNATVKIYLTASVLERAKRRQKDELSNHIHMSITHLEQDLKQRDYRDSHRKVSPLRMANDAIKVDTTNLNIPQVTKRLINIIKHKLSR